MFDSGRDGLNAAGASARAKTPPVEDAPPAATPPAEGAPPAAPPPAEGAPPGAPPWDALAGSAPGPELLAALLGLDLGAVEDLHVLEAVAAWQRLASFATRMSAAAAAELDSRDAMHPAWPRSAGRVRERSVTGEEVAARLACSRQAGRRLVRMGRAFEGALWPTGDALAAGEIDPLKARVLVEALDHVGTPVAAMVQEEVLPAAGTRTPTELARDVELALQQVDPLDADHRASVAHAERRVSRPRPLPDGMAGMWAVLPAPAAVALSSELDAVAVALRGAGDQRTLEQLRADVLCGALLARPEADADHHGRTAADRSDGRAAADGPAMREIVDRLSRTPIKAEIQVTVPLDVLLGESDDPAHLEGYGALPATTARALARGGTWRRIVTDPLSGMVHDVGRRTYRPPADMVDHVRARDVTCVRPGCSTPARACEIDHTVAYGSPPEGRTATDNLGCLCRRDHLLKTHAGFDLVQDAPGVFTWITPAGQRIERPPRAVGRPTEPPAAEPPAAGRPARAEPPDERGEPLRTDCDPPPA